MDYREFYSKEIADEIAAISNKENDMWQRKSCSQYSYSEKMVKYPLFRNMDLEVYDLMINFVFLKTGTCTTNPEQESWKLKGIDLVDYKHIWWIPTGHSCGHFAGNRNKAVCLDITRHHNLTMGTDSLSLDPEKLRGSERSKVEIRQIANEVLNDPSVKDVGTFTAKMRDRGVQV